MQSHPPLLITCRAIEKKYGYIYTFDSKRND